MQVQNVFTEQQGFVGVVPNQIFDGINFGIARDQNSASHRTQLVVHSGIDLFAHARQNTQQTVRFFHIGCAALARKVPRYKLIIGCGAEEAPRHNAAGVNEMLYKIVGLGHGVAFKCGWRQIVQALKTATLQKFCQAALQCHFHAGVRTEGRKHAACFRVHQSDAHDRINTA